MALTQTQIQNAKNLTCEKCGSEVFKQTFVVKSISGLLTEDGREMLAPVPIFSCSKCEHVNDLFAKELKINTADQPADILQNVQA